MPSWACRARCDPSNANGLVTTPTVEGPDLVLGDFGDHRRRAGAGASALAGGDKHHVGALQRLLDFVARLGGGTLSDIRVGAGPQPFC